jgi:hypothetical protein
MPSLLKQRTLRSPGIITFTHNEVLNGVPAKSVKVQNLLTKAAAEQSWIFGVHIQGNCSHITSWPTQDWQSFLMWSDPSASFLLNVPKTNVTPITCVNFLPETSLMEQAKVWDLCVVSRPSKIKKITETLLIVQQLFALKDDLKVVFIVPDPRDQALGDKTYRRQAIDRNYFELPRKIFSCKQLKNISFISSSQRSFGTFPISDELVSDIIGRSRFLMLNSHLEGVPRVIAEAFTQGTPCVVSKRLVSGLNDYLNHENAVFLEDEIELAARQIKESLDEYHRFKIDRVAMQKIFCETWNAPRLRAFLSEKILATGADIDGDWYLDGLNNRLACHGVKHNMQFMNDDRLFFNWMAKIEACIDKEPDEDYLFGNSPLRDRKQFNRVEIVEYFRSQLLYPSIIRLRSALRE